jgi:hypothetical protein
MGHFVVNEICFGELQNSMCINGRDVYEICF